MSDKDEEQQQEEPMSEDLIEDNKEGGPVTENEERLNAQSMLNKDGTKKVVPGIIYLGHIPPRFRPRHVRNLLSGYGEMGRIFLQPEGWWVCAK